MKCTVMVSGGEPFVRQLHNGPDPAGVAPPFSEGFECPGLQRGQASLKRARARFL